MVAGAQEFADQISPAVIRGEALPIALADAQGELPSEALAEVQGVTAPEVPAKVQDTAVPMFARSSCCRPLFACALGCFCNAREAFIS